MFRDSDVDIVHELVLRPRVFPDNATFVSNPYRSTNDSTYGITQYSYDALSRVTTITNPDNSTRNFYYSGAWENAQDEGNGSVRIIKLFQRDALGRVTTVCEVSGTTQLGTSASPVSCGTYGAYGFLTNYTYDPLGNLTYVTKVRKP